MSSAEFECVTRELSLPSECRRMDEFLPLLLATDTRKKITIGADVLKYISEPDNSIECEDIGQFIDGIVPWMQNSNFKVRNYSSL